MCVDISLEGLIKFPMTFSGAEGDSEEEQSGEEEDLSLLDKDGGPADTVNAGKGKRTKKKKAKKATEGPR